jgi:CHC2 zinc finger/Protein of unknown function (DUF3631)
MSDLFERVKQVPIESVVREYFPSLELGHSGQDFVAHCPFHDESTPSFHLYVEKNRWHCFGGCAKGGSAIDLLLMAELASQPLDAAKALALKFGIEADEKQRRKAKALTVAQYATFCGLPDDFLVEKFSLANSDAGVKILYKDESGEVVSVQRRHKLEKGAKKDQRFSWRKGDKPIPYGLWFSPEGKTRLVVAEGASDVHVLSYCGAAALGIPGASNFKPEMASSLLSFAELVLIQEPGEAGEKFVASITAALKAADYKGTVRAVSLPEKDPRALWLTSRDKTQFTAKLEEAIVATTPIDLYPPIPRTADLISEIRDLLTRHVFFKDKHVPLLIAVWVLGTYVYDIFAHFGYLWINSPVKRCGKSLLEDILSCTCFKASPRLTNCSEAAILRLSHEGGSLMFDELENLKGEDRQKFGQIMSILNNGFQAGGKVPRVEKGEDGFKVVYYNAYCPKVLAGISRLVDTIEDRSFKISMVRKARYEKVQRFKLRRQKSELENLRRYLSLWANARRKDVEEIYDGLGDFGTLAALDDRFQDIVEPLAAIACLADVELSNGATRVWPDLSAVLLVLGGKRDEVEKKESIIAFVELAKGLLDKSESKFIQNGELLEKLSGDDGLSWIKSKKALATFLGKFDLTAGHNSTGDLRGYTITKAWIEETENRYGAIPSDFEVSEPSESQSGRGSEGIL